MGEKTQHCLLLVLCLSGLVQHSAALMFWSAVVEISYVNSNNVTEEKVCECGMYGRNSPLEEAQGIVTLPKGDPKGCGLDDVYNRSFSSPPWIALVKRGNCTFAEKINAAKRQGAAGVVVYNVDDSGNSTTQMVHSDAEGIVAIMIGNSLGMNIVRLVKDGTEVQMLIEVGNPHGPWMDAYWIYFLSIAFFIVTAASIAYFVFIFANRVYRLSVHRRSERRLKNEAKKAIGRLQVRTLKRGDEETTSDSHMCAVCIESYKAGDVVTVLTCDHIFHKACIEPWLLERRTCPMCKCDILKALGVEGEMEDDISPQSPTEVTVITVTGAENMYEVPLTDPASPDPERQQYRYDNGAFEGDSEAARG
ncbi:E3 ubiquitin-protein ligase RNF128-like [Acanthochromis polyacanthus]|uniref:E3 ubiquitin-protein ligase RNF128-like n=1 Tax=Acanthochromis polyacanthus TaxID=80966 RepID=A0A3Q1FY31_9TELE|nr:E3 ubiquitin-protein ligase RNF128-like [Acanthochromis polyacanthus]